MSCTSGLRMSLPDLPRRYWASAAALLLAVVAGVLAACAVNPVTGRKQLAFFSESEEIAMGVEGDRELLAIFGAYEDPSLDAYVAELGRKMAATSERPGLPWAFRLADDEIVNAFALPGGPIYVSRGLLAHLNREAELAGVLGHEIGHVTARHSVHDLSRSLAISLGVLAGLTLLEWEEAEPFAALGLGLLFLKFSRDQERQADRLAVRYSTGAGFDPHGIVDALRVLERVSKAEKDGWVPTWLSTHPDPEGRWQRLPADAGLGPAPDPASLRSEVDAFITRLDGLVYGPDPTNGALHGDRYVHLRDGYQVTFPRGWTIEREGQAVAASNPAEDALVLLQPHAAATPLAAAEELAAEEGVEVSESWDETIGGFSARMAVFTAELEEGAVRGLAAFIATERRVVGLIGLSESERWGARRGAVERSLRTVARLGAREAGRAEPTRIAIVTLDRPMTAREIAERYSPGVEAKTLALLNQVEPDERLAAGRKVKTLRPGRS